MYPPTLETLPLPPTEFPVPIHEQNNTPKKSPVKVWNCPRDECGKVHVNWDYAAVHCVWCGTRRKGEHHEGEGHAEEKGQKKRRAYTNLDSSPVTW